MRLSSAPGADTHPAAPPPAATEANERYGAGGKAVANLSQLTLISSIGWSPEIFVARSFATSCASSGDAMSILGVEFRTALGGQFCDLGADADAHASDQDDFSLENLLCHLPEPLSVDRAPIGLSWHGLMVV